MKHDAMTVPTVSLNGYLIKPESGNALGSPSNLNVESCRALWGAVVLTALKDMNRGCKAAGLWIFGRSTKVGSFRWVCDMCSFDYHKLCHMAISRDGRRKILRSR
jgi:hypothetical protein